MRNVFWTIFAVAVFISASNAQAQMCTAQTRTFTETFNTATYKDPASSVDGWGTGQGYLTLARKATSFSGESKAIGLRIYLVADGDWDNDGFTDMMALMLDPTCHIHFLRNKGNGGSPVTHLGFDPGGTTGSTGFNKYKIDDPPNCSTASPVLLSGDFDGDGDKDLLYSVVQNENAEGTLAVAYVYPFIGLVAGVPQFGARIDVKSQLAGLAWHWVSKVAEVVDWPPKDGVDDLVWTHSSGNSNEVRLYRGTPGTIAFNAPVTLLSNAGFYTPIARAGLNATGSSACPPAVSRGINGVGVADFDKDGDYDIVVGSISERHLKYWKNDGSNVFTRAPDITFTEGGTSFILVGDYDGDGDMDFMVGRDGKNCNGAGGSVWFFVNDGSGNFTKRNTPAMNSGDDLDFGISFDIDNDPKGRIDTIAADGNDSGSYFQIISVDLDIFNLTGTAISKPIDNVSGTTDAIVNVKVTGFTTGNLSPPARDISFFVSNNNGATWETVTADELPPNSATHNFSSYGSDLRWRAELKSPQQTLSGDEAVYSPATKISPTLHEIRFSYETVDRRAYSRSSVAYGTVAGREYLYSASYMFPGFEATVRVMDITGYKPGEGDKSSGLETVDSVVATEWSSGDLLRSRLASTRTIYAAYDSDGDGKVTDRVDFTTGNEGILRPLMAVDASEFPKAVRFVRGENGNGSGQRPWKFFDVGHSSPVFVGAPKENPLMFHASVQASYASFKITQANRTPMVYIGANDGMLHAFDAVTGAERWAMIPNNLLAKVKNQRSINANGVEEYRHDDFVDGKVVVNDVYDSDANAWKTVAVVGQARGQGRADNNFYFAVDITSPTNPRPMWEFTDALDNPVIGCDATENVRWWNEEVCPPPVCSSSCSDANHVFLESGAVVSIEAEHYSSNSSVKSPHEFTFQTSGSGHSGVGYMVANPDNNTDCSTNITNCGAQLTYQIEVKSPGNYYVYFRTKAAASNAGRFNWGVNGTHRQRLTVSTGSSWSWNQGDGASGGSSTDPYYFGAGEHTINVWMARDGFRIDKIVLKKASGTPSGDGPNELCRNECSAPPCTQVAHSEPLNEHVEWPNCGGTGSGLTCCGSDTNGECRAVGSCSTPKPLDPVLGETWSPPAVGAVQYGGKLHWLTFFGSGYRNENREDTDSVGSSLYALDLISGTQMGRWDMEDLAQSPTNPSTLDNTLPGGARLVDFYKNNVAGESDGLADLLYIGDLEGRLWRLDLRDAPLFSDNQVTNWEITAIFDAGAPTGDAGPRVWSPIITTPSAAWISASSGNPQRAHIYFGTGGDDRAPGDTAYRFYAIVDDLSAIDTRYPDELLLSGAIDNGEFFVEGPIGHKFWSDPLIVDDAEVYFTSLSGKIESVNPCESLGAGDVPSYAFGYAMRKHKSGETNVAAGISVLKDGPIAVNNKLRQGFITRALAESVPTRTDRKKMIKEEGESPLASEGTEIFVQMFSGDSKTDIGTLPVDPIAEVSNKGLRVLHWREVDLEAEAQSP